MIRTARARHQGATTEDTDANRGHGSVKKKIRGLSFSSSSSVASVVALFHAAVAISLCIPGLARAQPPDNRRVVTRSDRSGLSLRPFVMGTEQSFHATETFETAFGQAHEPFIGGGLQVVVQDRYYVEIGASRFRRTGERVFRFNDENFRLGLPLTTEVKPLEVTGGYRFHPSPTLIVVPYVGAGFGSYGYTETSPSSDPDENVDARHSGFVLTGGAEVRVHRWVHIAADAQYTHVPGILGLGGFSKAAGENDLGGIAARLKVIVGR